MSSHQTILELDDASVMRDGRYILDGLTLAIHCGEHTAIIGANGSGKSTLMKLLTLQHYPLAHVDGTPSVRVFGRERWDVFALRRQLGIVSSDMHLALLDAHAVNHLSALDIVLSGFFASLGYFEQAQIDDSMRERAYAALNNVGALALAQKSLDCMSTGEARRVLIARALVHEPQALILDEPTTGLDLVARFGFMQIVRNLARQGRTVILVTHHFDEVIPEIQRVILLRHGRIAADGAKAEVLQSASVSAAFEHAITLHESHGYYHAQLGG
ncbi:ATP-binding cassette domain-containing protein [Pseudolysobacter antarcticus]|uniref:ATP-binding cassette domain-containing protein n=1 Tax=Pseudolysobacter antarcticus TaxID=2511995 RepID=A0A411HKI0_9GAMM|nr:ATP-binding cassette domain-containing protein [Pseudolysobacter antarcticus]QBB71039.1 ATP-binding cassette domain-containing protein [Pseudolysobacter antarcticus]